MDFKDKTALIAGASRGLGKAVALEFASRGANCALVATNASLLESVKTEVEKFGAKAIALPADIKNENDVIKAVSATVNELGGIDYLINCAGIASGGRMVDIKATEWDEIFDVNMKGTFLMTRETVKFMLEKGIKGRIVNVSSTLGKTGAACVSAYSASKFAVIGFTQSIALELASKGITVNAICPGAMDTDMLNKETVEAYAEQFGKPAEVILKNIINSIPLKRIATPEEVAKIIAFLVSEEGSSFTGQAINPSCGLEMH